MTGPEGRASAAPPFAAGPLSYTVSGDKLWGNLNQQTLSLVYFI